MHLGDVRQSFDIDSNLAPELAQSTPDPAAQASFLKAQIPPALRRHFERQNPVKFKLGRLNVVRRPPKGHRRGWNAFLLRIEVQDNRLAGVLGLPKLEIAVAPPQPLAPGAANVLHFHQTPTHSYA